MTKTDPGNFFEDFTVGQVIEHATPRTITDGDRALYGAIYPTRFAIPSSAAFAASVERKESGVVLFDLALLASLEREGKGKGKPLKAGERAPAALGYGFADGRISGRFELPIEQVKAISAMTLGDAAP